MGPLFFGEGFVWRFLMLRSSGTWQCFSRVLLVLLCCFGSYEDGQAAGTCKLYIDDMGASYGSSDSAGAAEAQRRTSKDASQCVATSVACNVGESAINCRDLSTSAWACDEQFTGVNGPAATANNGCKNNGVGCGTHVQGTFQGGIQQGTCLPPSPCMPGRQVDTVVQGGAQPPGTTTYDSQGCAMQITSTPTNIIGCGGGCAVQSATYNGLQQSGGTPESEAGSNCVSGSSGTFCSEDQNGKNCGTFNGDEVCPASLPPGTCQSFASGGVACTASASTGTVTSPPGPNNGTAGTPAAPTGQVQAPGSGGSQVTSNYYSATTVAASTGGVASSPGGTNVGNGGSGSSGGSGSGSAPNAANGDCGASGVSCTGTVPSSTWAGDCTDWNSCFQGFYAAVGQAPIVQGAVAIESAWPAGACDIGSVSMETFGGKSFDYGATACQVWNNYIASPLSAILLAVFAVAGIFIVLSA